MRRKSTITIALLALFVGTLVIAASGRGSAYFKPKERSVEVAEPQRSTSSNRRMVDMIADDSYLIERGDSTIFILVGNFAAHHNGAVILADSAVRYSNSSFECFGNVLINQNDTYAYGDRAEYNRWNNTATIYSELVKVVDGEAVMYTYHCTFDTAEEIGYFRGGCYVEKDESLMESDRGYYYTETHELIAVGNVEMRDATYQMTGDSVIFNTETEDARYFSNTNIWNDKDEYLFANEGFYTKATDTHTLTRDAYILSPEREIWSDSLEYRGTDRHIVGRGNIQVDDTTQKILGFADYGEWWDEPGNALFTRRPSMINYDPEQGDSIFLAADTLWLYTIAVLPETEATDSLASDSTADRATEETEAVADEEVTVDAVEETDDLLTSTGEEYADPVVEEPAMETMATIEDATAVEPQMELPVESARTQPERSQPEREAPPVRDAAERTERAERTEVPSSEGVDSVAVEQQRVEDEVVPADTVVVDSTAVAAADSVVLSPRYEAKLAKRAHRDSLRTIKRNLRDSLRTIRQAERDSIEHLRDSLLDIKLDTIIAQRIARNARIADEEAARLARVREKAELRRRRQIDRAKARAERRGREYTGEDYTIDSIAGDSTSIDSLVEQVMARDTMSRDTVVSDSLARDTMAVDSASLQPQIPADSVYKMIKAYRHVRMYGSESQVVCDSLVVLNTDSIVRLYINPIMWNEDNQVTADSMAIYTRNRVMEKAHFMGDPIMGSEIDTMYYNQVKGKEIISHFANGKICQNDVNTNAQTIYYMQEEEGNMSVTGLMYIESASITFYFTDGSVDRIVYKQNPEYVLYPIAMVPASQQLRLTDFEWHYERRPGRDSVFDRVILPSRRESASVQARPRFRITERINYDRRRLVENRVWVDRLDELTPEVVEWRNSRPSYQNR